MSRRMLAPALMAGLVACGPASTGPGSSEGGGLSERPQTSVLAACLLEGGRFETAWSRQLDATGITALAAAPDGSVAVGEGAGAVGVLRALLSSPEPAEVFHDLLLPAAGHASSALSFSEDGQVLVSGDAVGQVASLTPAGLGPWLWERVGEEPVRSVAARADGGAVAWVDAGWAGNPRLWAWPEHEVAPEPVETFLWGASDTVFSRDDTFWLVAGDWYGVPAFDVRFADAPETVVAEWMMSMETVGAAGGGGFLTAVDLAADDGFLVGAGTLPFLHAGDEPGSAGGGFLVRVDLADVPQAGPEADARPFGLPEGRMVVLEDHRPVAAHLLPGDAVLVTRGADGDVVAWSVDGFERLASIEVEGLGATAPAWDGDIVLTGDSAGRLSALQCVR